MKSFVKISGFWYEYDSSLPLDCTRIFSDSFDDDAFFDLTQYEKAEAEKIEDLDWNETIIFNNDFKTGWLSPEGKFYGCDAYHHRQQAMFIHKKSEVALEQEGWIRVNYTILENWTRKLVANFCSLNETVYPTREQLKYLLNNYSDNKELYYEMWSVANIRKELIKEEWGMN